MSAAIEGSERRGTNSGPGQRRKNLPTAFGRNANLQYVQPQYRSPTPLPGGGKGSEEGDGAPPQEVVRKISARNPGEQEHDEHGKEHSADIQAGLTRHVNSFKSSTQTRNIFADYEDDEKTEKEAEEGQKKDPDGKTQPQSLAVEQNDSKAEVKDVAGSAPSYLPQAEGAPAALPTNPVPAPITKQAETQKMAPVQETPKKHGCCVVQ